MQRSFKEGTAAIPGGRGDAADWRGAQQSSSIEEQVEREQLVHELFELLPEAQRELVFMRFCLDLTYRDIARVTGVNVCMVQYRVKRGLAVLRSYLERNEAVEQEIRASHRQRPKELPHAPIERQHLEDTARGAVEVLRQRQAGRRTSFGEFYLAQLRFISRKVWAVQLLIVL